MKSWYSYHRDRQHPHTNKTLLFVTNDRRTLVGSPEPTETVQIKQHRRVGCCLSTSSTTYASPMHAILTPFQKLSVGRSAGRHLYFTHDPL